MKHFALLVLLVFSIACFAQEAPADQGGRPSGERRRMMGPGVAGVITEIRGDTISLKSMDGKAATVKIADSTEFRIDRQPGKLTDLKVGDTVFVRGESAGENTWKAQIIAKGRGGRPGTGNGGGANFREELGKRFIAGEVTKIDEAKLTIKRVDGETQVIEADENTSFRNQTRESITLADIKVGDKVFGRGELKDGVFVPAMLNIGDLPMRGGPGGERGRPGNLQDTPAPEKR